MSLRAGALARSLATLVLNSLPRLKRDQRLMLTFDQAQPPRLVVDVTSIDRTI